MHTFLRASATPAAFRTSQLVSRTRAHTTTTASEVDPLRPSKTARGGVLDPDAAKPTLDIDPFKKAERLGRPMSPHMTIYDPQLTWYMSIFTRITGVGLTSIFYFGSIWYGISPYASGDVVSLVHSLPPAVLIGGKAILAVPIIFHSTNGVRHLIWDTTKALTIKGVYNTGYVVLGLTAVGTVALALQ
ncbi:cytochrome b subunit of succinate dehydrogenase, Sdh3p [Thoreauomyces humboldtii]|nr:cytochrome b subunit of succinate dehydrogenase, Sdh3p [Thoreauomyces humboldtii]